TMEFGLDPPEAGGGRVAPRCRAEPRERGERSRTDAQRTLAGARRADGAAALDVDGHRAGEHESPSAADARVDSETVTEHVDATNGEDYRDPRRRLVGLDAHQRALEQREHRDHRVSL